MNFFKFTGLFACLAAAMTILSIVVMKKISFRIPQGKNILVLGDSHTECAVNDNILDRALNVSSSATSYYYSFAKLKNFVKDNPQIDTVILSYHPGSLDPELDEKWLFDDALILGRVPAYISLIDVNDFHIFLDNPTFYKAILRIPKVTFGLLFKSAKSRYLTYEGLALGKFTGLEKKKLAEDVNSRKGIPKIKKTKHSIIELTYLKKITSYCKQHNIEVIFLSTPVFNAEKYTDVEFYKKLHEDYFSDIRLLDHTNFKLPESSFADVAHINLEGSIVFTKSLEEEFHSSAIDSREGE